MCGIADQKKVNIPEPLNLPNSFFDRQRKARLLKAAEPKRHYQKKIKKLFGTDRQTDETAIQYSRL